jgi:hypothetical protein
LQKVRDYAARLNELGEDLYLDADKVKKDEEL